MFLKNCTKDVNDDRKKVLKLLILAQEEMNERSEE